MLLLAFLVSTAMIPTVSAWSWGEHDYMCPQDYAIDCKIADTFDFQKNYPYAKPINHVCLDNKSDGAARLVAKYFVKKYYVEGQKDLTLLGAAAHLLQDASCPDHWYSALNPFAPGWAQTIENQVESLRQSGEKNWSISIDFQGRIVIIDDSYLLRQKAYINDFLSKEPDESLEEIGKQVDAKLFLSWLRGRSEWFLVPAIIMVPALALEAVQWKRKGKPKKIKLVGTILAILVFAVLLILLLLIQLFY